MSVNVYIMKQPVLLPSKYPITYNYKKPKANNM